MFKDWLKFYFLGFFSNNITRQAPRRGWWNCLISFVLAVGLLIGGFLITDAFTLEVHYKKASAFRIAVRSVLTDESITYAVHNGELDVSRIGSDEKRVVDTFISDVDRAAYGASGYAVVVDTRDSDAYDDFTAYCVSRDGNNTEISYEEYKSLSAAAQAEFRFAVRYSGNELVLDENRINGYAEYLKTADDGKYAARLDEALSIEESSVRNSAVYELYVEAYYPSLKDYERDGAPKLRNYYLREYVEKLRCDRYLFLFDDCVITSFATDGGIEYSLYGFYGGGDRSVNINSGEDADAFILESFNVGKSFGRTMMIMNLFQLMPIYVFGVVALTLLLIIASRLIKSDIFVRSGDCYKTVSSFLTVAAVVAAVCAVIIGFAVGTSELFMWTSLIFFGILTIRVVVLIIGERARLKALAVDRENKFTISEVRYEKNR